MRLKTQIEMANAEQEYMPQKRMKSILKKEKEALMDTDQAPLSYSMIDY
jgi:hypothetical protein